MERVMSVDAASVFSLRPDPPKVGVTAHGQVPTTGWTQPRLSPWFYITPPQDGIQDFDFVAEPPTGIILPMLTPVAAFAVIERDPRHYWGKGKPLVGVRIHARENSVEAKLDARDVKDVQLRLAPAESTEGGEVPWPWLSRGVHTGDGDPFPLVLPPGFGGGDRLREWLLEWLLLGKSVRVYHTGDPLARDLRPDRLNLELSPTTERIVNVWFG